MLTVVIGACLLNDMPRLKTTVGKLTHGALAVAVFFVKTSLSLSIIGSMNVGPLVRKILL